ncbi:MAG: CotH kinase family protein [Prolixibacteraceae bacterium]
MIFLRFLTSLILIGCLQPVLGQVVMNEVQSRNTSGIIDDDAEYSDWIELYNTSNATVNLKDYSINDNLIDSIGWVFPDIELPAHGYLLIFASGKDRKTFGLNYKTVINRGDDWQYVIPPSDLAQGEWRSPGFDAAAWQTGKSGFGYGDNDDQTVLNSLNSIFIRKEFSIDKLDALEDILLHVDYDDGFIAFLNGKPIAMENVQVPGTLDYNNVIANGGHEAEMYQGGQPTEYRLDLKTLTVFEGSNVLAVQGYNTSAGSSDFSLAPYLTIGATNYGFTQVADFIQNENGSLHTNFKIKNEGESLFLFNAEHQLVDSLWVVELPADVSYGRFPDGASNWKYFMQPTPGEVNANPIDVLRNDSVFFSLPSGFYSGEIQVELSTHSKDVVIRYTTDGAEPTAGSLNYFRPISLSKTTPLRAAAFLDGIKISELFTHSFFINETHTLPVFSIVTDPPNLWDYNEGIYELGPNAESGNPNFGANFWQDWEKQVHLDYFDEQKIQHIDQDAGIKIAGAWSRANAQKSLAVFARSQYGKGSFRYSFFKDLKIDKFESFLLRNSGNDWSSTMLRDGYVSEIAKVLNVDRLAFQPAVVYLNGEYWGIQNQREKPNEAYFEGHYGIQDEELNLLEVQNQVVNGSSSGYLDMLSFLQSRNLHEDLSYKLLKEMVDVDCFIDYELIQIYIQNTDWPGNNIKFWNSTKPHSKWRWLLYDTDFGFDIWDDNNYRDDGLSFATNPSGPGWPNPPWSTYLLRKLLTNDDFKNQFMNRMADLLNTTFQPDIMDARLDSIISLTQHEMSRHLVRWGQGKNWLGKIAIIQRFNANRPAYVWQHFNTYFSTNNYNVTLSISNANDGRIKVNSIVPDEYPFMGSYFGNVPVKFTALPKVGYKFVRWEKGSTSTDASITLKLTKNLQLQAVFEPLSGNEVVDIVINEINYFSGEEYNSGDWLELYNNSKFTIDLHEFVLSDVADPTGYIFPENTLLYPDAYLVVCNDQEKFSSVHSSVRNVIGNISFGFSRKGDELILTDPQNNLVDRVKYETYQPWPIEPFETAATLELKNVNLDNNLYSSWEAGPLGGTPGAANYTTTSNDELVANKAKPTCFPTRFHDYTTLRFQDVGSSPYTVKILDLQGRLRNLISGEFGDDSTHYLDIFTETENYQPGIYFVHVQTATMVETIKVLKL